MALTRSQGVMRTQRNRLDLIRRYKVMVGCSCGERRPECLDLHHRDRTTKTPKLSKIKGSGRLYTGGSRWQDLSYAEIVDEIRKCDVRCSNCHRVDTAAELGWHGQEVVREKHSPRLLEAEVALGLTS